MSVVAAAVAAAAAVAEAVAAAVAAAVVAAAVAVVVVAEVEPAMEMAGPRIRILVQGKPGNLVQPHSMTQQSTRNLRPTPPSFGSASRRARLASTFVVPAALQNLQA